MIIKVDLESEKPIYEQLVNEILYGIATGKLKEGDSLPSVRQLGIELGINLHTVNKSYNILKQQGFLLIHRQKGAIVNPNSVYIKNSNYLDLLSNKLEIVLTESYCRQVSEQEVSTIVKNIYEKIERGDK